ncbi:hypothetical protein [Microlunatus ginsengisoli]
MTNTMGPMPTTPYGATSAYPSYQSATADPGRTLGIVGLILSPFVGLVGLILSLVALRRSKRAGFGNVPAMIGAIVGGLATLGVLVAIVVGGLAIGSAVDACRDLGPGQHVVNGVTYTCG